MAKGKFGTIDTTPSGRYRARYMYHGVRGSKTFLTYGAAGEWLRKQEKAIGLGSWVSPREQRKQDKARKALTVGDWVVQCIERRKLRETTRATYMRTVTNRILDPIAPGHRVEDITRLKDIPATELTKQDVYRWWDAVKTTYPDTGEQNIKAYKQLKSAYIEAVDRDMVEVNPVRIPKATERHNKNDLCLPTKEELLSILECTPDRYKLFTVLLFFHGLRIGEVIGLEVKDIICVEDIKSESQYKVQIRQNVQRLEHGGGQAVTHVLEHTKTSAGVRMIDFLPAFNAILEHHMECYADSGTVAIPMDTKFGGGTREVQLLTVTAKGRPVWDTSYREVLRRAKVKAGIPKERKITPHSGRRWFATQLAESGASVKTAGALMGDKDTDTIMNVYMKVDESRLSGAMTGINDYLLEEGVNVSLVGGA